MEWLQRFQDRSISIIDTTRIKDDWKNFLQVKQLITFDRSVMTYKIMNRLCPENLWSKFQRRSHCSNYNTRFCENLQSSKYNLECSKKRSSYTALKAWNEIPMISPISGEGGAFPYLQNVFSFDIQGNFY